MQRRGSRGCGPLQDSGRGGGGAEGGNRGRGIREQKSLCSVKDVLSRKNLWAFQKEVSRKRWNIGA